MSNNVQDKVGGENITSGIHNKGSWGDNPNHIGRRPTIFYAPVQGSITV